MGFLKILLLVLAAIVLLIVFLPVGVEAAMREKVFYLSAEAFFLKLRILPGKEKKSDRSEKPKEGKGIKQKKKKRKMSLSEIFELIPELIRALSRILRAFKFKKFDIHLTLGFPEDGMKTAMAYGAACACVSTTMPLLEQGGLKKYDVSVDADFDEPTRAEFDIRVRAILGAIILAAIIMFFKYLKIHSKYKKEVRK